MTFADKLKELRERASTGPVLMEASSHHLHQVSLHGRHNRIADDMLAWDADLYAFLANHAAEIEALVEKTDTLIAYIGAHGGIGRNKINEIRIIDDVLDALAALEDK